jgi:hypothetical protein
MKAAIFSAIVVVVITVLGGFYKLGYDGGAKDFESLSDFKAHLPQMLEDMKVLAKDFRERAQLNDDIAKLKNEAISNTETITHLSQMSQAQEKRISELQQYNSDLEQSISKLFTSEKIRKTIEMNSAEVVIPDIITIGLNEINGSDVYVTINGDRHSLAAGESVNLKVIERTCQVQLAKIENNSADFVASCATK